MTSRNHKYALILMAAVAMTATGALSTAYAQQVSDGMDGYVVGDPDGGAGTVSYTHLTLPTKRIV